MFSMPERLPGHLTHGVDLEAIEEMWPLLAADLADLEIEVRSMTAHRRRKVSSAEVRLARRAARRQARRVLRGQPDGHRGLPDAPGLQDVVDLADRRETARSGLGVCESCRTAPAVARVTFADLVVFAVCAPCAAGAVGVAA